MAESDISAIVCQEAYEVSRTWQRCRIKRGASAGTSETWKCSPLCTSSTTWGAILSSSWPSSSFEVVIHKVFWGSCGYIPPVCRNGQWWTVRNTGQIAGLMQSLCICNDPESGQDQPICYCSKPCSNNSEVLGIELAVAGICMSFPVWAKQITTHMVTEKRFWWLW